MQLLDIVYPFQDISDIVNSSFLNSQLIHGHIEINGTILTSFDELYKLLGEDREAIVLSTFA